MLCNITFNSHHSTSFLPFNPPKPPIHFPFHFSHNFKLCATASHSESDSDSFTVSYLINTIGFPRETAIKASKRIRLKSPEKPNSVFTFFRNYGFSDASIKEIAMKEPRFLSTGSHNSILPKLEFFLSKGASISEIATLLAVNPRILQSSLENRIIPLFEVYKRFLKSDKAAICCMIRNSRTLIKYNLAMVNIKLMIDYGVCDSSIARLILTGSIIRTTDLINTLEEVKGLGFCPSTSTFGTALTAKIGTGKALPSTSTFGTALTAKIGTGKALPSTSTFGTAWTANIGMSKALWDDKVDVFKKWGWSDEAVFRAFRRQPCVMLVSIDKINSLMSFWVGRLGWDSLALTKMPQIFGFSLQKRVIPRASVLQYLMMKGLRTKNASLLTPFAYTEKKFLSKFVVCFKDESDYLLRLYEESMNHAYAKENIIDMPFTK